MEGLEPRSVCAYLSKLASSLDWEGEAGPHLPGLETLCVSLDTADQRQHRDPSSSSAVF